MIHFMAEFMQITMPATMKMDNMGAMFMAKNDVSNKRTKHIDLRYHMIRDYVKAGFFMLEHVGTSSNRADIMTKALERLKHEGHTNAILRDYLPDGTL